MIPLRDRVVAPRHRMRRVACSMTPKSNRGAPVRARVGPTAGRNPYDKDLTDLIGELSTRSEIFRKRWADHNVRQHRTGQKKFQHPAVGDMELNVETMSLFSDFALTLVIYTVAPDSPSADGLRLLSTWAATQNQPETNPHERLA
ncbi:hypothetical protein [Streptomyces sp. NPDC047009]|uniref:MmyB family transcriptional regulator n=1 Tax=Streptomyces sp. NPDC047009 TaxID=3154496 RepID=UPI0033C942C7